MSESTSNDFGKYRLLAELGSGGMADVFLAVQQGIAGFAKLVVIKRLKASLADDAEFVSMLLDEARIAARLNHPNVVQTNEIGNIGEKYFIAMEFLDGQPLHRIIHRSRGTGEFKRVMHCSVLADVLSGLHHAHELADFDGAPLGIVHRDATPHNVFVTYDGQVKIVDFGIAKAVGRASPETQQGVIKGKISYMSPEQAVGQDVDRRADVFAVGVMLWEAVTGRRMWKDHSELQILHRLLADEIPRSPREHNPDVPEDLDAICRRALAPLGERFATAEEMRCALEQHILSSGGRPSSVEVGRVVSDLFEDKRKLVKATIESKVQESPSLHESLQASLPRLRVTEPASSSVSSSVVVARPSSEAGSGDDDATKTVSGVDEREGRVATKLTLITEVGRPGLSSRVRYAVVVATAAAVSLAVAFVMPRRDGGPAPAPSTFASETRHAAVAPDPPAAGIAGDTPPAASAQPGVQPAPVASTSAAPLATIAEVVPAKRPRTAPVPARSAQPRPATTVTKPVERRPDDDLSSRK